MAGIRTQVDENETRAEEAAANARAGMLAETGSVEEPSDVDWFLAVTKSVYKKVKSGDWVAEVWDPMPYYPNGKVVGLRRCLLPVDLGTRFHDRRYRLALTDRAVMSKKLSTQDAKGLKRSMGLKPGSEWSVVRKVPDAALPLLARFVSA